MPLVLRQIRKSKWLPVEWLSENDLQADTLADLKTQDNGLSVWIVDDDKSNLNHIISALAAGRDHISNFDYALFDREILSKKNIKTERTKGVSADSAVNELWHLDLLELSADKILELARHINTVADRVRIQEKRIKGLILEAVKTGRIKQENLKDGIRTKINS